MRVLTCALLSSMIFSSITAFAQPSKEDTAAAFKLANTLSGLFKKLGPGTNAVIMNWKENSEVKEVLSYPPMKRIAAINLIIWNLQSNDEKLFPLSEKNQNQLAVVIISRIFSYANLRELTNTTDNDIAIRDYLDGELSDLKLTINNKIPYGIYVQMRKQRADKITYLLMPNQQFVEETLKLKMEKNSAIVRLTNKTTAVSVMEACTQNTGLCEKL